MAYDLTEDQKMIVDAVREFVEQEVIPVADDMEHADEYPMKPRAVRDGDDYVINGQKMWATNGLRSGVAMTLTKTADTDPPYKGMSMFIVEKEPGAQKSGGVIVGKNIQKLGYKGVE